MILEIVMEMYKITSNVIKFRIKMFQLVLLPGLELAVAFMPPLLKTDSIEKINKNPVVLTGVMIKTIIMDLCKITSNIIKLEYKCFNWLSSLDRSLPWRLCLLRFEINE